MQPYVILIISPFYELCADSGPVYGHEASVSINDLYITNVLLHEMRTIRRQAGLSV